MPVFVTAADRGIGPALVAGLRADGADVRAFATGSGDVGALRTAGAFVAVGDLDDEGHLDAAMTDAHTVVVSTDTWTATPSDLLHDTTTVVRAAVLAEVRRLVLVSMCGADAASAAPLLAAYGQVEDAARDADLQSLVVRIDGVVEHGLLDVVSGVSGCDDEVLAPVTTTRLVDGLVALDAARSTRVDGHVVFTALGEPAPLGTWRRRLVGTPQDGTTGSTGLVGRRWSPPDRRSDLRAVLAGRGGPPRAGADLWTFDPASGS